MDIEPVDLDSDLALRAVYDVERRAGLEGREDMPWWSWAEMSTTFRRPDPGEDQVLLVGTDDGRVVGAAMVSMCTLDNTDKAWLAVFVDPDAQGRGHGRRLVAAAEQVAAAAGRTVLLAEIKLPFEEVATHRRRRFAEEAGYDFSQVEVVRLLGLPVPAADLRRWSAHAAEAHPGYRVVTYRDRIPEEHVASYCAIVGQLVVDAPSGAADFEEEVMTLERHRTTEDDLLAAGRRLYQSLAITGDGEVVAYSTVSVPPAGGRTDVSQWGTLVAREHRGHRLGLAVKTANLLAVQEAHPEMRRVVTQNAETNDHMVAINEQLGFEPVEASVEMIKRVRGPR